MVFLKRCHPIRKRGSIPALQKSRFWRAIEALIEARTESLQISNHQLLAEIAEHKQLVTELRQQNQQLNQTLEQMQAAQAQQIQAEKMSSLGQLVAGIAHEINNPINFIHGNLNPAKHYITDLLNVLHLYQKSFPQATPEIHQQLEEIDLDFLEVDLPKLLNSITVGSSRIREIVRSLRTFSRLDEAEKKAANIHEGIDSALLILKNRCKAKTNRQEITIIKNYGQLPEVECYPGQLNQVFMNVIANAIDAIEDCPQFELAGPATPKSTPKLTPKLQISTELLQTPNDKNWVRITITDNGVGMSPEVSQYIFDPFFTTKPVGKGTGLGLSTSYQIVVERHGGSLNCTTVLGQGTEMVIQIPHRAQFS